MPHLFLAVTAHGYGHLAQAAPVVGRLAERLPGLRVTLQGEVDPAFAASRLPAGFTQIRETADVGLLTDGPLRTRWNDSLLQYERFEADYARHRARQIEILRQQSPDLVLADVPWLPLDAARSLGIPAIALCSLNWHDILLESPVRDRVPTAVLERMRAVYDAADCFIRPAPSMPMPWLSNAREVGPIAARSPDRREELRERLGVPADRPLALMQFGGVTGRFPVADWPEQDQVHWLVPRLDGVWRRDATGLAEQGLEVSDVLGSCDLILCKPGYGSFTEAVCHGIPVLYVVRGDWPEEEVLIPWLRCHVPAREVALEDLLAGRLAEAMAALLAAERLTPLAPTGIGEAADLLEIWLKADPCQG